MVVSLVFYFAINLRVLGGVKARKSCNFASTAGLCSGEPWTRIRTYGSYCILVYVLPLRIPCR